METRGGVQTRRRHMQVPYSTNLRLYKAVSRVSLEKTKTCLPFRNS